MAYDSVCAFRLPQEVKKELKRYSKKAKLNMSQVVVLALCDKLNIKYIPEQFVINKSKKG